MTADYGLPVGVATPRLLSSTAIDGPTGPAKLDALRWGGETRLGGRPSACRRLNKR